MLRIFVGKVNEVKDQNIKFTFPDLSTGTIFEATPISRISRLPQKDDEVLIFQPNDAIEMFLYTLTPSEDNIKSKNITVEYNKSTITLSDDKIVLNCKNSTNIEMTESEVTINGHLKVTK